MGPEDFDEFSEKCDLLDCMDGDRLDEILASGDKEDFDAMWEDFEDLEQEDFDD